MSARVQIVKEDDLRETNHGIGQLLQLKQLDDVLTVIVLLFDRDFLGLSQVGRESKSLSYSRGPLVNILQVSNQ
jgi:hypothetical protein